MRGKHSAVAMGKHKISDLAVKVIAVMVPYVLFEASLLAARNSTSGDVLEFGRR